MRQANVYVNGELAGILTETGDGTYIFQYDNDYYMDQSKSAISLTLPKTQKEYHSESLFPFFFNMLTEGANKNFQTQFYKTDENDYFKLLTEIASHDTIGAVKLKKIR